MTTVSTKELKSLINSFKEALQYWIDNLEKKEIPASKVNDPIVELSKLTQLIKAHTTKVGIIFKPDTIGKQLQTAYNTLSKLSETDVLLVSLVSQLDKDDLSIIFHDEIVEKVLDILNNNYTLAAELNKIVEEIDEPSTEVTDDIDERLISVAKIWSSCDSLTKVLKDGKLELLKIKFKQSIYLIEDGLDEFEEWVEDPEEMDDPFDEGFSDDEEDKLPIGETLKAELSDIGSILVTKIKLIKLLLTSTIKSLPSITSGSDINTIYDLQRKIVNLIDKMIVELMMNNNIGVCNRLLTDLDKVSKKLISLVKTINKSNEAKIKWCTTWETKFYQNP